MPSWLVSKSKFGRHNSFCLLFLPGIVFHGYVPYRSAFVGDPFSLQVPCPVCSGSCSPVVFAFQLHEARFPYHSFACLQDVRNPGHPTFHNGFVGQ